MMAKNSTADTAKTKRPPFAWRQPCCPECWVGLKLKTGRKDDSLANVFCCFCKQDINAGSAYLLRLNPGTVPYPTLRKDDE